MNRWLVTVLVIRGPRRGYPRTRQFEFDVRLLAAALFLIGAVLGWHLR
jgi:hypothetical protein